MVDILELCLLKEGENTTDSILLQCALWEMQNRHNVDSSARSDDGVDNPARTFMLIMFSSIVFFMQTGFAMVCAGAVRKKNVQNTMLKNLLDACVASIAFFTVGYAFAFGGTDENSPIKTFMGTKNFFLIDVTDLAFGFFQFAFSAASATIVAGSLAERCHMIAYLGYTVLLTGWVYPIVVHALWDSQGLLSANNVEPLFGVGMIDYAGSAVVHVTGGTAALIATTILGPRRERFHDNRGRLLEKPSCIKGHSPALQMLGTLILWFGWYSFSCGTVLVTKMTSSTGDLISLAAANTTLAAGSGGIAALLCDLLRRMRSNPSEGYFDLQAAMNGCLAGLVAVTAGCTAIEPWAAVLVGIIAGIIFVYGIRLLQANRIDDAVDAIPVHLFCGIWGAISVGLVASPDRMHLLHPNTNHIGLLYSFGRGNCDATLLGVQVLGLSLIVCWVSLFMLPFSLWLDYLGCLRCNPLEEIAGIDSLKHGERRNSIEVKPVNNPINVQDYEEFKNRRQMKNEDILRKRAIIQRAITSRLSSFSAEGSLRSKMSDASDKSQSKTVSESSKHNSS